MRKPGDGRAFDFCGTHVCTAHRLSTLTFDFRPRNVAAELKASGQFWPGGLTNAGPAAFGYFAALILIALQTVCDFPEGKSQ